MRKIIKDRKIIDSHWQYLTDIENPASMEGDIVVSLADWLKHKEELLSYCGNLGLLLQSDEEPSAIENPPAAKDQLKHFHLIAINFPVFSDGRGYSIARELRSRYDYQGEIRATGDVLRDQLLMMERCGFNAFEVREDRDINEAIKGFQDFSFQYQADHNNPLPSYRR